MQQSPKKLGLTAKIFIGMIAGIITGVILKWSFDDSGDLAFSVFGTTVSTYDVLVNGIFNVIGQIFINSLKMLIVPLVFVSLVCGVANLSEPSKLGRLGGKSVLLYIGTTAIAITVAMIAAIIVQPGSGIPIPSDAVFAAKEPPTLAAVIIDIFPSNPFQAFTEGKMLQVITFAVLFGLAIAMVGDAGRRVAAFFEDLNTVIMKLVTILMNMAPYGVFALLAKLFTTIDEGRIASLALYFVLVFAVLLIHAFVNYSIILKLLTGLNPKYLFLKMREAVLFAFSTASSSATLPVTMETATKKLGIGKSVASFVVPLGSTINMDGTAIMQGVATVFIAQVYGIDLSTSDMLMVVVTATLASVGTAGVPGVGTLMLSMVLVQVGLPVEGVALILGVDRLLDMTRTAVNITGDCMVSCVVAKSENELDESVYYDMEAGEDFEKVDLDDFKSTATETKD
ncbi:dicarboxylate/amino acid:cation symporter [Aliiglaciecola sp. 3_MG-2023]|uniref:dicarboxylate/amino acid:cation symporter n=1 Tax=Aliiglaciecola sp. 3_MG-2023 TaxID=3062644 RepID=UPI0026E491FD|nr:dicarboxylate/amino acid:cation symporter [Aliiglaciecola sp. 3_MG-2023]MDO6692440.1 dicarboxylate/amino acid:cation symporter [Aliiglaciecola sp. 3_MG-2023]